MKNGNTIPSVDKAVALLEHLGKSENGATQQELARALGITASTCYRILQTLLRKDWVRQHANAKYEVSGGILMAAMKLVNNISRFDAAQPILENLAVQTGLSCKLSIRQGDDQVTILRADSPKPMTISGRKGARFPVAEGSVGGALLSGDSEEDILAVLEDCAQDIAEKITPEMALERVADVRKKGYCLNTGQNRWKIAAMSVPVKNSEGEVVAALTILGFDDDFVSSALKGLYEKMQEAVAGCERLA